MEAASKHVSIGSLRAGNDSLITSWSPILTTHKWSRLRTDRIRESYQRFNATITTNHKQRARVDRLHECHPKFYAGITTTYDDWQRRGHRLHECHPGIYALTIRASILEWRGIRWKRVYLQPIVVRLWTHALAAAHTWNDQERSRVATDAT